MNDKQINHKHLQEYLLLKYLYKEKIINQATFNNIKNCKKFSDIVLLDSDNVQKENFI